MNRREFFALTAGAALGGVVAGAVANRLPPVRVEAGRLQNVTFHHRDACLEMQPELPGSYEVKYDGHMQFSRDAFVRAQALVNEMRSISLKTISFNASIKPLIGISC